MKTSMSQLITSGDIMRFLSYLIFTCSVASVVSAQHEEILPQSTVAVFSASNYDSFNQTFSKSGLYKFFQQPDVRDALKPQNGKITDSKLGVVWTIFQSGIVRKYADGQYSLAAIPTTSGQSICLIFECESAEKAENCVQQLIQAASVSKIGTSIKNVESSVLVCDSKVAMEAIIRADDPLADSQRFTQTVNIAKRKLPSFDFWFYGNLGTLLGPDSEKLSDSMKIAMREGVDSLKALGGVGRFDTNNRNVVFLGEILADKPFRRGMRLANLSNSSSRSLPGWAENGTSSGFLNLKMNEFTNSFSTVFEALAADGEEDIFAAVLDDLKNDPNGPNIDIDKEIVGSLGTPACFSTTLFKGKPSTLIGIPLKDRDSVVNALTRFYQGDQNASKIKSKWTAWKVEPLESIKTNSSQPYVIAVTDDQLFLCADISIVEQALQSGSSPYQIKETVEDNGRTSEYCFGYRLKLMKHVHYRYQQLLSGKLDGLLDRILGQAKLTPQQRSARIEKLPPVSEIANFFSSQLTVLGRTHENGWSIFGSISD